MSCRERGDSPQAGQMCSGTAGETKDQSVLIGHYGHQKSGQDPSSHAGYKYVLTRTKKGKETLHKFIKLIFEMFF